MNRKDIQFATCFGLSNQSLWGTKYKERGEHSELSTEYSPT